MPVHVYDPLILADAIHGFALQGNDGKWICVLALECEGKSLTAYGLDDAAMHDHIRMCRAMLRAVRARNNQQTETTNAHHQP